MALINKVMPGYTATMWTQTGASPVALTDSQLSIWTAQVAAIVGTAAGGTGVGGIAVPVEVIPPYGSDDAVVSFSVAGARTGAKMTTQNQPTSMAITSAWNSADTALLLIRGDGYSGSTIRTYVFATYDGTNTVAYAINARIGGMTWDQNTASESKFNFTVHPVGGASYGWSTNS